MKRNALQLMMILMTRRLHHSSLSLDQSKKQAAAAASTGDDWDTMYGDDGDFNIGAAAGSTADVPDSWDD